MIETYAVLALPWALLFAKIVYDDNSYWSPKDAGASARQWAAVLLLPAVWPLCLVLFLIDGCRKLRGKRSHRDG